MFAAVAGLRAHQSKMDVIGNNIANVNTYGYKTARASFRDVFYATNTGASEAGATYGGTNPSQLGYGSKLGSIDSIMSTGGVATTDCSTDCMIIGNGFFMVGQMPQTDAEDDAADAEGVTGGIVIGTGGEDENDEGGGKAGQVDQTAVSALQLTRVGIFNFDGAGNFVDSNGRLVYGFATTYEPNEDDATAGGSYVVDRSRLVPLKLPNANVNADGAAGGDDEEAYEPQVLKEISIGQDGTITGKADNGETVIVGQIAIANVPNPNALERTENSYYNIKANTGEITVNPSGQNSTGTIQAGCLEMSNVDLSREFTDMITTQRGYQANTRIITVTDAMLEELVNMKR